MTFVSRVSQAWLETRHTDRHSVFRPVLIEADNTASLCLLRDVSPYGMRATTYTDFASDDPVRVHFSTDLCLSGAIAWSDEGKIGVQFNQVIDVQEFLSQFAPGTKKGKVARSQRLPIHCSASLTANDRTATVQLQDISQRGAKVSASFLQPGDEVHVQLDGLKRRKAVVRWIEPQLAGLAFVRPLAFEELAQWVACQQNTLFGEGPTRSGS